MAEIILLNRIRVDIGNVSGSLSELMQYAGMAGFNDNYEPQAKPRLVGTWTINDWYTQEQLTQAHAAFDGLTIIGDPNYLIDFGQMAVQVLDDTQPNYNPAVAIILQAAGYGITFSEPPISGQSGRWFISKSEAAARSIPSFQSKTNVIDANAIVSNDSAVTYSFNSFIEFQYFTSVIHLANHIFLNCTMLKKVVLPNSAAYIDGYTFYGCSGIVDMYTTNKDISISNYAFQGVGRFIIGDGLKYSDEVKYEYLHNTCKNNAIISKYDYTCPNIEYNNNEVTISTKRLSDVYYTTDGTVPNKNSTKYNSSFVWDGSGVLKVAAIEELDNSDDITYVDFYASTTETPTISYNTITKQITVACNTADAAVYYTIDGTCPTLESSVYSDAIDATNLGDVVVVRCFAVKNGMNDSEVTGRICVMDDNAWNNFAVQCIDNTKPNYNIAQCIILNNNGELTNKCKRNGGYFTYNDASLFTLLNIFNVGPNIVDINDLIDGGTYQFDSFSLLPLFTSLTNLGNNSLNNISVADNIIFPSTIVDFGTRTLMNAKLGNHYIELQNNVTNIGIYCFGAASAGIGVTCSYIHIKADVPPTFAGEFNGNYKVYVGDGSSASHDDAILADYVAAPRWSSYANKLDTWYNYLHP